MADSPLITVMHKAAEKAAMRLARAFNEVEQLQVSEKGPGDFVSSADLAAEDALMYELKKAYPDYAILSEESGLTNDGKSEYQWVIDPLDGTNNFLHSIPHFCVSVGLVKYPSSPASGRTDKKSISLEAGLIMHPLSQDVFHAEKKGGAYLNNKRLKVSARKKLEEALLGTGQCSFRPADDRYGRVMTALGSEAASIRCMGAAALDLAYVAAGKYDGFWQHGLKPWDTAAGLLLVKEAGGLVRDLGYQGDPFETGNVLASNSNIAPKLDRLIASALKPKAA